MARLRIRRYGPAAEVALERLPCAIRLIRGKALILDRTLGGSVHVAVLLDHLARHPALAELRLDHAVTARRMPVALLAPPPRKGGVVHVAQLAEPFEGRREDGFL